MKTGQRHTMIAGIKRWSPSKSPYLDQHLLEISLDVYTGGISFLGFCLRLNGFTDT
jgi:hypothetical protein